MKTAVLALIVVAAVAKVGMGQPDLEILEEEFWFGTVPQNATVRQSFWFKSTGTDTLVIKRVKTGCSCVIVPLEKDRLAPGDSMLVQFFWDTQRRMGRIQRYPYIFTNAREDAYRVYLTAMAASALNSIRPVSLRPYKCELAVAPKAVVDSVEIVFTNHLAEDLSVIIVSYPVQRCKVVMPQQIPAEGTARGHVTILPEYRDNEFKESVTIEFSDESNSRVTIPIRRKLYGPQK